MDIASIVLGIVSLIFSFFCGCISIITAPIGLTLGIVDLVRKKDNVEARKGMAIAGVVMCVIAIALIIVGFIFLQQTGFWSEFMRGFEEGFNSSYY